MTADTLQGRLATTGRLNKKEKRRTDVYANEMQRLRQYLIPNEKAIRAAVKSLGTKANIPGIRVFEDINVRFNSKRGGM